MRWIHKIFAKTFGYFWKPCPLCGQYFGGHETKNSGRITLETVEISEGVFLPFKSQLTCSKCADDAIRWNQERSKPWQDKQGNIHSV